MQERKLELNCELPGCDRRALTGSVLCGAHLQDVRDGFYPVWNGGELLPRTECRGPSFMAWMHGHSRKENLAIQ